MWREGRRFVAVSAVLGILASLAPILSGGVALGFSPAPEKSLHARNSLGASGCKLLAEVQDAKIWVGSGGHKVVRYQPAKTCSLSSCWQEVRNPSTGGKSCAYRRGAILSLDVEATPVIAKNRVRLAVRKGYEPLNIPADVAGITSDQSGTGIILAVDRTVALLTYGAQSDTAAHPVARLARFKAEDKAEHIALRLRNEGCPQRPVSC